MSGKAEEVDSEGEKPSKNVDQFTAKHVYAEATADTSKLQIVTTANICLDKKVENILCQETILESNDEQETRVLEQIGNEGSSKSETKVNSLNVEDANSPIEECNQECDKMSSSKASDRTDQTPSKNLKPNHITEVVLRVEGLCADEITHSSLSESETLSVIRNDPSFDSLSFSQAAECDLPSLEDESTTTINTEQQGFLLPPELETRRCSSQYDNISDLDKEECPPCPTDSSLNELERQTLRSDICNVLDLSNEQHKSLGKLPQLKPTTFCYQGPSGSVPSLHATHSGSKGPTSSRTTSSPNVNFSPCQVIKTVTSVQVCFGTNREFEDNKHVACLLPKKPKSTHASCNIQEIEGNQTDSESQKKSVNDPMTSPKNPPRPTRSPKPKLPEKPVAILKALSDNNFYSSKQTVSQMTKSITF